MIGGLRLPFLASSPRTVWKYAPGGFIWRVLTAPSGSIVGESRSEDQKRVRFFCLDDVTGTVRWESLPIEEPWWVGIEAVHEDVVLVHGFAKPDLPEHRGLFAFDLTTGVRLWASTDTAYSFVFGNRLHAIRTELDKRVGVVLDLRRGTILEEQREGLDSWLQLRREAYDAEAQREKMFPDPVPLERIEGRARAIIEKALRSRAVEGPLDYLSIRDWFAFSFHERTNREGEPVFYRNDLYIGDRSRGLIVYRGIIDAHARTVAPDGYFIRGAHLYFIRDRRTLTALQLWKS